ncbi:hypothetical protein GOODEAATRI_025409, partial [Goodea atripinnis]
NMRSRSNSLEDVAKVKQAQQHNMDTRKRSSERDEPSGRAERRSRRREPPDDTATIEWNHKIAKNSSSAGGRTNSSSAAKGSRREKGRDLSRDDLVFLLSLLEGELQVIQAVQVIGQFILSQASCRHGTDPSLTWI